MDLFTAIAKRHSYRGDFLPEPIPRSALTRIVQAGIQAPSGCNAQSTTFVIVDDAALLEQIAGIVDKPFLRTMPAMIACVVDTAPVYEELSFAPEDCAAAVENMLLAITALGYASVWLDGVLRREGRAQRIGQILRVPAERRIRVLLPVGCPKDAGVQREKKPFAERAWFNAYATPQD